MGPMGYNGQNTKMSERLSTYCFDRYDDYQEAKDHLYEMMSSDYYNSDAIYDYGSWGSDCWRIDIYSECSDPERAARIFREHRGKWCKVD